MLYFKKVKLFTIKNKLARNVYTPINFIKTLRFYFNFFFSFKKYDFKNRQQLLFFLSNKFSVNFKTYKKNLNFFYKNKPLFFLYLTDNLSEVRTFFFKNVFTNFGGLVLNIKSLLFFKFLKVLKLKTLEFYPIIFLDETLFKKFYFILKSLSLFSFFVFTEKITTFVPSFLFKNFYFLYVNKKNKNCSYYFWLNFINKIFS